MGIIGFRRGLVEELGRLLGLIFSTIFALRLYVPVGSFFANRLSVDTWLLFILSFISIFISVLMFARIVTKLIHFLFLSKSTKWVNLAMGTIFGMIKGAIVIMICFWMVELMPNQKTEKVIKKESRMADKMKSVRKNIVSTFNLQDPIIKGEKTIESFLEKMDKSNG